MKILAVSDIESGLIYSTAIHGRFKDTSFAISCGDLPSYYLEYIVSCLDIPLYFVYGNHTFLETHRGRERQEIQIGAINLDGRVCRDETGVLLAGIEGSLQYNRGPHQYSQAEMWRKVLSLVPSLLINHLRHGRYLDIFVTHAPPWQIHDQDDLPHRGIKAFRWLNTAFRPTYHLHGHVHIYNNRTVRETLFHETRILNVYGYKEIKIDLPKPKEG